MFKRLIEDLIETGMTETAIALRVGASQASINRIKRTNQNPKYELGVALVALHGQITQKQTVTEQAPESTFGDLGEPRDSERRVEDRRTTCADEKAA